MAVEPQTHSGILPRRGITEIRCPEPVDQFGLDTSLFIAGGIGLVNVHDWQRRMVHGLLADVPLTALNPRRDNFPHSDPNALREQIGWEHRSLNLAQAISFWLPAGYSCPITIYELGVWSMRAKPIFVGIDPEYPNRDSIIAQLEIVRPELKIVGTLEELAEQVKAWQNGTATLDLPGPRPAFVPKSMYLSGGILGCPDWQAELTRLLENVPVQLNDPRQRDLSSASLSSPQLQSLARTNHQRLLSSESLCVWFPEESKSPASLFELGVAASMTERPLFVGAHPSYFRASDVRIQTGLVRPEVRVVDSLEALAEQVQRYYRMR